MNQEDIERITRRCVMSALSIIDIETQYDCIKYKGALGDKFANNLHELIEKAIVDFNKEEAK